MRDDFMSARQDQLPVLPRDSHYGFAMNHLRYAGLPAKEQTEALKTIIRTEPVLMAVLDRLRALALPDAWLTSGALYNTVWNRLTGRPPLTGINDFDLIYFDDSDLSYEAEDRAIARATSLFAELGMKIELRNQARVHLWFPQRFGMAYPQLTHTTQSLEFYASKTHAVAARLAEDGHLDIEAPFGLDDIFSFRMVPNRALNNRETHERKCLRAKAIWPELVIEPW